MNDFITLDTLGTFAGTVGTVIFFVEVLKFLIPWKVNPKLYCVGVSILAMLARALILFPATTARAWIEAGANVLVVAVVATGLFEFAVKPLETKILQAREAKQQLVTTDEAGGDDGE
jgi:hypothetical protein